LRAFVKVYLVGRVKTYLWASSRLTQVQRYGVARIEEFNLAFLGKWRCLLYDNHDGLWFKVVTKYRIEGGHVRKRVDCHNLMQ